MMINIFGTKYIAPTGLTDFAPTGLLDFAPSGLTGIVCAFNYSYFHNL